MYSRPPFFEEPFAQTFSGIETKYDKMKKMWSVGFLITWIMKDFGRFHISTESRLWHRQRGQAPGLAMSRCLGDALGSVAAETARRNRINQHLANTKLK